MLSPKTCLIPSKLSYLVCLQVTGIMGADGVWWESLQSSPNQHQQTRRLTVGSLENGASRPGVCGWQVSTVVTTVSALSLGT